MPARNQFLLMKDHRFLPLFVTQFFGAFHDNLFKNALIVMILYKIAVATGMSEETQKLLTTLAAGTLVLPFFFFSAIGGQLADKYPKNRVMRVIKLFEIGIAVLGATSLIASSIPLSFFTLFLLGTHSAFFGPCKYSVLPELIRTDELIGGNALLNTGTFLAILLGTIAGMSIITMEGGAYWMGAAIMSVSLIGYAASRYISEGPVADASIKINLNPFVETFDVLREAFSQKREVVLSLLGKGWFFCAGSLYLSQFPNYVKGTLLAGETVLTFFTIVFSIGIGIGGLLNNRILKGRIAPTFVPLAALGLTVFSVDIFFASASAVHGTDGTMMGLSQFLAHPANWRILLDVCLISICGGLYVVPLTAILQDRTADRDRARIMAGGSITDSLFMVLTAVVSAILISKGWAVRELFLGFAALNIFVAIGLLRFKL